MQGNDQILLKVANLQLNTLENHYWQVNQRYLGKIRTLKQLLRQKELKQVALKQTINTLKVQYEQHNKQVKQTLDQINRQHSYTHHISHNISYKQKPNILISQKSLESSFIKKSMEAQETGTLTPKHKYSQKLAFFKQGELLVKSAQFGKNTKYRERGGQLKNQTRILLGKTESQKQNKFRASFEFSSAVNPKQKNNKLKSQKMTKQVYNPEQKIIRK